MSSPSLPRLAPCAALLALASCAPDAGTIRAGVGSVDRPALSLAAGDAEWSRPRAVRHFEVEQGRAPWVVSGGTADLRARDGLQWQALRIDEEPLSLQLPPVEEPFDQVVVTLRPVQTSTVSCRLGTPGAEENLTVRRRVLPGEAPLRLLFDLDGLDRSGPRRSELALLVRECRRIEVLSIDLLEADAASRTPDPGEPARPFRVGDEARAAVGLSVAHPLSARLPTGGSLLFSSIAPKTGAAESAVRLTLVDSRGRRVEQAFQTGSTWASHQVGIDSLSAPIEARFELEGEDGAAVALGQPQVVTRGTLAPTVLLITSDTHRADHVACMPGSVDVRTPSLDRLAARGLVFEDCVSGSNVTHPSHATIMTGYSPRDHGLVENLSRLSDAPTTLAERFRDAGWVTLACTGLGSLSYDRSGLGQGFDRVSMPAYGNRDAEETVDRLLSWLDELEGLPVFAWVHFYDAHIPYAEREGYSRLYYPAEHDPRDPRLPELAPWQAVPAVPGVRDLDYLRALYRSEVTYVDTELGRLLAHARLEGALVVFTADHGESLGEHRTWFAHDGLYARNLRVPLVLSGPGVPAGERIARRVSLLDLGRTVLELAGLESRSFPGRSLLAAGPPAPCFALSAGARSACVLSGNWLLILNLRTHHHANQDVPVTAAHSLELYDLERDPSTEVDVAERFPEVARDLRRRLVEWLCGGRALGWNQPRDSTPLAEIEALRELGYTDEVRPGSSNDWIDQACDCEFCRTWRERP